jgi:hypothetical protein
MAFPADIDLDGSTTDRTALYAGGTVSKLSLNGNLGADTVVQGDLPSVKITGSVAGDVCIGGSIPKPSVSGNWAGAIAANWIGSPKIGGTLSGSITTYSGGPNGVSIGKLTAGRIGNLVVNVSGGVSGIAAAAWADGSLRAAWLASLSVKGATGVPGDFGADLTLFGAPGITTLGKASIAGTLQDAAWSITGPVSGLTVGRWGAGSTMAVGVNPGPDLQYFTGDDQALVPAPAHGVGKLTIVAYDNAHAHDFGILAAYYWGSFKLGPLTQVPPVTDGQFRIVQVV